MVHFSDQQIIGATEFRRHLGKYMKESSKSPLLIMGKNNEKRLFINISLFQTKNVPNKKYTNYALEMVRKSEEDIQNGNLISFDNSEDAINHLDNL